jgi:hypothetical protein
MPRRAALGHLGRGLLALAGVGALVSLGARPGEVLARSNSNTPKKPRRKTKSNGRKGTSNKRPK